MQQNLISEIRNQKSITQKALAKELEISYWHLNKVERGKASLSIKLAARIARALDINMQELLQNEKTITH
jgi:DNA-binding XRE family transcriptional regulator